MQRAFDVRASAGGEWAWAVGRVALALIALGGVVAFLSETAAYPFLLGAVAWVIAYDAFLAWLLIQRRVTAAFAAGLALDTVTIIVAWLVTVSMLSVEPVSTDTYLILFPVAVVCVIRLGWPLGVLQASLFIGCMALASLWFLEWDSYEVQQLPLRVMFMASTVGLTAWLATRLRSERRRAETLWHETAALAEMGRVVGSSFDLEQVYDRFANLIRGIAPARRVVITRLDVTGRLVDAHVNGESAPGREGALCTATCDGMKTVIRDRAGRLFGGEPGGPGPFMAVPLIAGDMVTGTIGLEASDGKLFTERDLLQLERITYQVSPAIESARLASTLVESEARLRSVLDANRDAVVTLDNAGVVTGFSRGAVAMFGYDAGEIQGRPVETIVWPEAAFRSRFEGPEGHGLPLDRPLEMLGLKKDGTSFPVEVLAARLTVGPPGLVLTVRDITERKAAEDARMRLLQTVAHELRTPLSSVLGARDMLTDTSTEDMDSVVFGRLMGIMDRGVDRLDMLAQELTDLVELIQMQRGTIMLEYERVRLSPLVDAAVAQSQAAATRRNQTFNIRLEDPDTEMVVDARRMSQVFQSLLMHAVRVSPTGSTIDVAGRLDGQAYEFRVRDRGPGIPPEDEQFVFDPFSRAASETVTSNEVRGLRLAIARGFVEAHGGEIGFRRLDDGIEFYVRIPAGTLARSARSRTIPA